jgi:ATP-binding cassette subfamily B protein
LFQITTLYLATILIGLVCDFGETYLMSRTGQLAMLDLRRSLMEQLHRLDIAYYDHNPVGRLITRVTTDVDALNELWASGLVAVLGDFLSLGFVPLQCFD